MKLCRRQYFHRPVTSLQYGKPLSDEILYDDRPPGEHVRLSNHLHSPHISESRDIAHPHQFHPVRRAIPPELREEKSQSPRTKRQIRELRHRRYPGMCRRIHCIQFPGHIRKKSLFLSNNATRPQLLQFLSLLFQPIGGTCPRFQQQFQRIQSKRFASKPDQRVNNIRRLFKISAAVFHGTITLQCPFPIPACRSTCNSPQCQTTKGTNQFRGGRGLIA